MSQSEAKVLYLNRTKRFTLEEARMLLPKVKEVTNLAVESCTPAIMELQRTDLTEDERIFYNIELKTKVDSWAAEITRLGAVAKGLWLVDFDSGEGYYCWRYSEEEIEFFHTYDGGFSTRTPIQ